jgi:hypothetical protein
MVNGISAEEFRMKGMMEEAGIPWGVLTPEQQYGQFASEQFRPGPGGLRSAFTSWDVREPLLQQYYLAQPSMPEYGGFADFMTGGPAYGPAVGDLRDQAQQAALMARMPGAQFFEYASPDAVLDPVTGQYVRSGDYAGPAITSEMAAWNPATGQYEGGTLGALTAAQQLMYRQQYGTGPEAAANQAQLANLLALQRTGDGMYGGPMGQAITGALGELRGQFLARNPEANFLDWYLSRTADGQGVGGFLTA